MQSLRRVRSARSVETLWLVAVVPVIRVAAWIEVMLPTSRQATDRSSSVRWARALPLGWRGARRSAHSGHRAVGSMAARASWLAGGRVE